jgi:predicted esterase
MSGTPDPVVRTVAATVHGRYLRRPAAPPAEELLVGFHGYAQDCAAMLAEIDAIPGSERWTVLSVQALHRFYNRANQVVANWMTSQDRELAIADNVAYVRNVLHDALGPGEPGRLADLPLVFAGFSQGAAMAFRAAASVPCAGVIALGGDIPPDVRASASRLPPVLLGRGVGDTWYTEEKLATDANWLRKSGTPADVYEFEGGHEWTAAFRERAAAFLGRVLTASAA